MSGGWSPTMFFRPNPDEIGRDWEVVDPLRAERAGVDREVAAKLVLSCEEAEISPESESRGVVHWRDHNWERSLSWYMFTRKTRFVDVAGSFREVQEEQAAAYAEQGVPSDRTTAESTGRALVEPADLPADTVGEVLFRRASTRSFPDRPLREDVLSALLWRGLRVIRRYKSADKHAPLERLRNFTSVFDVYVVTYNVPGLAEGVYLYDLHQHTVIPIVLKPTRELMQRLMVGQRCSLKAGATFLLVAEFERCQWRYRHERALRKLYINSGRFMHHLLLVATVFGLRTHISPAVCDGETLDLLDRDRLGSQVLYTLTVG